jgi:hypothetical protein
MGAAAECQRRLADAQQYQSGAVKRSPMDDASFL